MVTESILGTVVKELAQAKHQRIEDSKCIEDSKRKLENETTDELLERMKVNRNRNIIVSNTYRNIRHYAQTKTEASRIKSATALLIFACENLPLLDRAPCSHKPKKPFCKKCLNNKKMVVFDKGTVLVGNSRALRNAIIKKRDAATGEEREILDAIRTNTTEWNSITLKALLDGNTLVSIPNEERTGFRDTMNILGIQLYTFSHYLGLKQEEGMRPADLRKEAVKLLVESFKEYC